MSWDAIKYVSTGLTLAAFVVAAIVAILRYKIRERERLIKTALPDERAPLVQNALEFFDVDTTGLTRERQFDIAMEQIKARERRFTQVIKTIIIIAIIAGCVSVYAIYSHTGARPSKPSEEDARNNTPRREQVKVNLDSHSPGGHTEIKLQNGNSQVTVKVFPAIPSNATNIISVTVDFFHQYYRRAVDATNVNGILVLPLSVTNFGLTAGPFARRRDLAPNTNAAYRAYLAIASDNVSRFGDPSPLLTNVFIIRVANGAPRGLFKIGEAFRLLESPEFLDKVFAVDHNPSGTFLLVPVDSREIPLLPNLEYAALLQHLSDKHNQDAANIRERAEQWARDDAKWEEARKNLDWIFQDVDAAKIYERARQAGKGKFEAALEALEGHDQESVMAFGPVRTENHFDDPVDWNAPQWAEARKSLDWIFEEPAAAKIYKVARSDEALSRYRAALGALKGQEQKEGSVLAYGENRTKRYLKSKGR